MKNPHEEARQRVDPPGQGHINVKLSAEQLKACHRAARREGKTVWDWARRHLLRAVQGRKVQRADTNSERQAIIDGLDNGIGLP